MEKSGKSIFTIKAVNKEDAKKEERAKLLESTKTLMSIVSELELLNI